MTTRTYLIRRPRKLPSGKKVHYWVLRWFDSEGRQKSEALDRCDRMTKRDAEDLRRQRDVDFGTGKARRDKPKRITLAAFFTADRLAIEPDVRESTLIEYDLACGKLKKVLGDDFPMDRVDDAAIGRLKTWMTKPTEGEARKASAPATVRKTLSALRAAFGRAARRGIVPSSPFVGLGLPKGESRIKRIFTRAEVDAMIKATSDGWWQCFIRLAVTTGMRRDELLNLRWDDIDEGKMAVAVRRKAAASVAVGVLQLKTWEWSAKANASYRVIPIPKSTIDALRRQRLLMGPSPFVFIDAKRLALLQRHVSNGRLAAKFELIPNLLRDFAKIQVDAAKGKPWPLGCLHDMRRTYCTWIADAVPMHVLRQWAGHSDISTTATYYLSTTDDMAQRARKALSRTG